MADAKQVSTFVNEGWSGVYITHKYGTPQNPANQNGGQLWMTLLHGPTGPRVFTQEHADGRLEDVTREYRG